LNGPRTSVKIDIKRGYFDMAIVEVLVLDGASLSSVAITLDLLATANRIRRSAGRAPAFEVRIAGSAGPALKAYLNTGKEPEGQANIVIVPGLTLTDEGAVSTGLATPGAADARERLRAAHAAGAEIASSCSGTFLVASAGLLDDRRATTAWWLAPLFHRHYPAVKLDTGAMVVVDGPMVTAGAAMAQLDLMLSIIARHAGAALASRCARYLVLDERRSQARYMALGFLAASDERVARAERWALDHLAEAFPISALADAAGLTQRTFARRVQQATGCSPVRFLQHLRTGRAVELLETTRLSFDEVAVQVGYADTSTLRRLMQREGAGGVKQIRGRSAASAV
jgi:transcriptional regulator GlxA family with amidase domain